MTLIVEAARTSETSTRTQRITSDFEAYLDLDVIISLLGEVEGV